MINSLISKVTTLSRLFNRSRLLFMSSVMIDFVFHKNTEFLCRKHLFQGNVALNLDIRPVVCRSNQGLVQQHPLFFRLMLYLCLRLHTSSSATHAPTGARSLLLTPLCPYVGLLRVGLLSDSNHTSMLLTSITNMTRPPAHQTAQIFLCEKLSAFHSL